MWKAQGNQPVHECHAVVSVQRVHQAIKAALKARHDTNWENASAARLERLERLQHHRSFYVRKRTLLSTRLTPLRRWSHL